MKDSFAAVLGVSSQLATYRVRKLAEDGCVTLRRRRVKRRVHPTGYEEKEEGQARTPPTVWR